ncbi:MAG: hypothetical protein AAB091_01025, partial [Elusimicrobiota bacterium]
MRDFITVSRLRFLSRVLASVLLAPFFWVPMSIAADRTQQALDDLERLKFNFAGNDKGRFRLDPKSKELKSAFELRSNPEPARDPRDVAIDFIQNNRRLFFNPPEEAKGYAPAAFGPGAEQYFKERLRFELDRDHSGPDQRNLLFRERYNGLPVEFSRVSAHLNSSNQVMAALSSLDSGVAGVSPSPSVSESQARAVMMSQWAKGHAISAPGELVYLPKRFEEGLDIRKTGKTRLAWKFHFRWSRPLGIWNVYVDAHTGELIGAVNELRSSASVRRFERDPNEGGNGTVTPVRGLVVTQNLSATNVKTFIPTDVDGVFTAGSGYAAAQSVFSTFVTTYAAIVNDNGANPIFSEGKAAWQNIAVSSSFGSSYPVNARLTQSFTCPANTIFTRVRFSQFDVGYHLSQDQEGEEDADFVEALQPGSNRRLGAYSGQNRSSFITMVSTGPQIDIRLVSNKTNGAGNEGGYTVGQINCLVQAGDVAGTPEIRFFDTDGVLTYDGVVGHDRGYAMAIDSSGRIVVAGYSDTSNGMDMAVWRYNPDGVLDASFGTNGVFINHNAAGGNGNDAGNAVAIDSSGRIVVAGYSASLANGLDLALWRLTSSGALDTTFSGDGIYTHDSAAGGNGADAANALAIDSSGRIVVAGYSASLANGLDLALWRLTSSGALDTTFSGDGIYTHDSAAGGNGDDAANAVAIDSSGRIAAAGYSTSASSIDLALWRLSSSGDLDGGFGASGIYTAGRVGGDRALSMAIDQAGNIYVSGFLTNSASDMGTWKLDASGALDSSFGSSGILSHDSAAGGGGDDEGRAIAFDSLGNLVIVGYSVGLPTNDLAVWKITNEGTVDVVASNALKHADEINLYFTSGNSRYDLILSSRLAVVHVNFGTDLANAFFDPEMDVLVFGEGGVDNGNRNTALATDVIYHEYAHLVVDHIYNIANFGHDGALSEAFADFFSVDAFANNYPAKAKTTFGEWAFPSVPRELNQTPK